MDKKTEFSIRLSASCHGATKVRNLNSGIRTTVLQTHQDVQLKFLNFQFHKGVINVGRVTICVRQRRMDDRNLVLIDIEACSSLVNCPCIYGCIITDERGPLAVPVPRLERYLSGPLLLHLFTLRRFSRCRVPFCKVEQS